MATLNKICLIGNVGRDPEIKTFSDGGKKISFTIATSKKFVDRYNQQVEETQWHTCIPVSDRLKTLTENYIRKGSVLYVEGEMTYRTWETQTGEKRSTPEIRVTEIQLLSKREQGGPLVNRGAAPAAEAEEDMPDFMKF